MDEQKRPLRAPGEEAEQQPRPSIRDVAARAGVSVGTVSNTLNRPESVREGKRTAVERAIAELNFIPNPHARSLNGSPAQAIGLIVQDIVSPYFMEVANSVEQVASRNEHMVVLASSENRPSKERDLIRMLEAQRIRGMLITPAMADSPRKPKSSQVEPVPAVYVDYCMGEQHCSVSVDHVAGAKLAAQHLLDKGHRCLAFVGDSHALHQFAQRIQGIREALTEAGLDPEACLTEIKTPGLGMNDGLLAGEALLGTKLPTGILCGNDMMAFGVFRSLTAAGVRVGADVALIGYDDIDFAADWTVPLTSVRQPTAELGRMAAELLLEHTSGSKEHEHRQIVLEPELIVRASSSKEFGG